MGAHLLKTKMGQYFDIYYIFSLLKCKNLGFEKC